MQASKKVMAVSSGGLAFAVAVAVPRLSSFFPQFPLWISLAIGTMVVQRNAGANHGMFGSPPLAPS